MAEPRVCPHCGCDRYVVDRIDRLRARLSSLEKERDRLADETGRLRSDKRMAEELAKQMTSALARKVERQRRAIRRMEKKLLSKGQQPHDDATLDDRAGVSDIPEVSA